MPIDCPSGSEALSTPTKNGLSAATPPSEIIGEALPRPAHARWKIFSEEGPHAGENTRGKEAERKAQDQHHRVVDR